MFGFNKYKGLQMQLTCFEREVLRGMFPRVGSLNDQVITRSLVKKLELTSIDMQDIGLNKNPDGSLKDAPQWDKGAITDFDFSDDEIRVLKSAVNFVDGHKLVSPEMIDICLKIQAL